jgi:Domain of unknown function (DUF1996)
MRRPLVLSLLAVAGAAGIVSAVAAAAGGPASGERRAAAAHHRGPAYFAVVCGFSHRNDDDMIVFPNQAGRSHNHTYFGNRATTASSTAASLRASARTSCRLPSDTAAYWAPTLFVNGRAVEPLGAVVYYVRRTTEPVQAFPAGLEMIAGDAAARSAQSRSVTFWNCGFQRDPGPSSSIPTCSGGRSNLRLQVNFPNCWDGSHLDSANHKSHMAYSVDGACPSSHPVETPAISLLIFYPVAGGPGSELASGGQFSGHADFVNAWDQARLERLVDRYLNRTGRRRGGS